MRNYKAPTRICPSCNTSWTAGVGGSGRRKGSHCDTCYPHYRNAYKLFSAAEQRAKNKGYEFSLTIEWVFERLLKPCPKTGMPFIQGGNDYSDRNPYSASIDKIHPDKGYTPENCQVVSWLYNCAKQRFSEEDVYNFCLKVVNFADTNRVKTVDQVTV